MRERGSDSRAEVVGSGRASEPKSRPCATLFRRLSTKQRSYVSRRLSPQTHAHTLTPAAHAPSPHPCLAPDGENHEEKKVREMRGPARSIAFFFFASPHDTPLPPHQVLALAAAATVALALVATPALLPSTHHSGGGSGASPKPLTPGFTKSSARAAARAPGGAG
jgi:hypothetical protein